MERYVIFLLVGAALLLAGCSTARHSTADTDIDAMATGSIAPAQDRAAAMRYPSAPMAPQFGI